MKNTAKIYQVTIKFDITEHPLLFCEEETAFDYIKMSMQKILFQLKWHMKIRKEQSAKREYENDEEKAYAKELDIYFQEHLERDYKCWDKIIAKSHTEKIDTHYELSFDCTSEDHPIFRYDSKSSKKINSAFVRDFLYDSLKHITLSYCINNMKICNPGYYPDLTDQERIETGELLKFESDFWQEKAEAMKVTLI